jgi:hypothetical protein
VSSCARRCHGWGQNSHNRSMCALLLLLTKQHQLLCLQRMQCAECSGNPSPAPTNATFACPSPALPGAVCNATCATGYSGTPAATCLADGTYSAVTGTCSLIGECLLVHLHWLSLDTVFLQQ